MSEIYQKLEIPKSDKSTSVEIKEASFIYNFIKDNNIKKTLEVGFAYGCSSAHIMSATKEKHYAIDPFQSHYSNLGLKNIEKLGMKDALVFKNDFSHNVLPELLRESIKFDFAFVDGGHKFDEIFIDFYYIDLLLKDNGYILFHDSWMRSTQHVASWIKNNKENYKRIKTPIKNLVLFQKLGSEDSRTWYHFKDFTTYKSLFSNWLFIVKKYIREKK